MKSRKLTIYNIKTLAKREDKNHRTIKKVLIEVEKLQKNGKTKLIGYIMERDILLLISNLWNKEV